MTETNPGLSAAELESQDVTAVPDREAMSVLDGLDPSSLLGTSLLNLDVDLALDADVAAPIDAAVAANVLSVDSEAQALASQDSLISQDLDGTAEATAIQDANLDQSGGGAVAS